MNVLGTEKLFQMYTYVSLLIGEKHFFILGSSQMIKKKGRTFFLKEFTIVCQW